MDLTKCNDQENRSWFDQVNFDSMMKMTMIIGFIVVSLGALWVMHKFSTLVGRAKVTLEMKGEEQTTYEKKEKKRGCEVITDEPRHYDTAKDQKTEAENDKNIGASETSWLDIGDKSVGGDSDKASDDKYLLTTEDMKNEFEYLYQHVINNCQCQDVEDLITDVWNYDPKSFINLLHFLPPIGGEHNVS